LTELASEKIVFRINSTKPVIFRIFCAPDSSGNQVNYEWLVSWTYETMINNLKEVRYVSSGAEFLKSTTD